LRKDSTGGPEKIDDFMSRDKTDFYGKAVLNYYKQLPKDVKDKYRTYDEFIRELREVDDEKMMDFKFFQEKREKQELGREETNSRCG
jgi:hypothetical protein